MPGVDAAREAAKLSQDAAVIAAACTTYPVLWSEVGWDQERGLYMVDTPATVDRGSKAPPLG